MSMSLAKIWARRIHDGAKTIDDVRDKYGEEGVQQVEQAYFALYGEPLQ